MSGVTGDHGQAGRAAERTPKSLRDMGPTSCITASMKKSTFKLLGVRQQWVGPRGPAHLAPRHSLRGPGPQALPSLGASSLLLSSVSVAVGFVRWPHRAHIEGEQVL